MKTKVEPITDVKFCRYLRAKSPYGTTEGGQNLWRFLNDSNTVCWCLKSSGAAGPDNGQVAPEKCVSGRKCYEAPRE